MTQQNPLCRQIIQSANIPSIPHLLQRILNLADDPRTSCADLEELVSHEPGLSARLLKTVNSAYYSLPNKISSIRHTMILLGFSTVKSVASGIILMNTFDNIPGLERDYIFQIWKRGLTCANLVRILSLREVATLRDDLFLAAMVHDVGHLVLAQFFREKYIPLLKNTGFPKVTEELEAVKIDHAEIAGELIKQWNFPDNVVEMVRFQHDAENAPNYGRLIQYIDLGDMLAELQLDQLIPDQYEFIPESVDETGTVIPAREVLRPIARDELGEPINPFAVLPEDCLSALAALGWSLERLWDYRQDILDAVRSIDQLLPKTTKDDDAPPAEMSAIN